MADQPDGDGAPTPVPAPAPTNRAATLVGAVFPAGTTTIRDILALSLIVLSAAGITVAALSAISHGGRDEADKVFTTVVGLGGAWVSTILVYYFSKENFQAAQTATQETLKAALGSSQPKLLVADK